MVLIDVDDDDDDVATAAAAIAAAAAGHRFPAIASNMAIAVATALAYGNRCSDVLMVVAIVANSMAAWQRKQL